MYVGNLDPETPLADLEDLLYELFLQVSILKYMNMTSCTLLNIYDFSTQVVYINTLVYTGGRVTPIDSIVTTVTAGGQWSTVKADVWWNGFWLAVISK